MNTFLTHKDNLVARCKQRGYELEEVMACVLEQQENDMWLIDVDHPAYPKKMKENFDHPSYRIMEQIKKGEIKTSEDIGEGVGTELKKILSWMNIHASATCSCNKRAKYMNEQGIQWCKENIPTILSWLKEESEKRKLPFLEYVAKKIVKLAIYRAEKRQHV